MANCYYRGEGVDRNYSEAVKWYRKAADQGYALAQAHLATCYYYGRGIDQNYGEAVKWCRKVADQGWTQANLDKKDRERINSILASCYFEGLEVEKDYLFALKCYCDSCLLGNIVRAILVSLGIVFVMIMLILRKKIKACHVRNQILTYICGGLFCISYFLFVVYLFKR